MPSSLRLNDTLLRLVASHVAGLVAGVGLGTGLSLGLFVRYIYKRASSIKYVPPPVWTPSAPTGAWGREALTALSGKPQSDAPLSVGEHPLQLYSLGTPNGVKVTILLEELGLDYDAWFVNIFKGDQFTTGFMEVNPNAMIPCLVDHSNSNEDPTRLFEANAILLHLAQKHGRYLPSAETEPQRHADCLSWLFWQCGSGPYFGVFNTCKRTIPSNPRAIRGWLLPSCASLYSLSAYRLCTPRNRRRTCKPTAPAHAAKRDARVNRLRPWQTTSTRPRRQKIATALTVGLSNPNARWRYSTRGWRRPEVSSVAATSQR